MSDHGPSPADVAAMLSEIHAQLFNQREQINQLRTQVANQPVALEPTGPPAPTPTPQSAAFVPKKNKPPTYDGKSSPDSWIAHLSSYVYGQPDDLAFSIAITHLSGFSPLNKTKRARDKLSRWRQIKDVQTYNTDFLKIIIDIPGIGLYEQLDRYFYQPRSATTFAPPRESPATPCESQ
jgi:hypothetical protein